MDYLYTILKFIIGGGKIVGVTFLAQNIDPRFGGILAAAPITTTIAFLLTYTETGSEATHLLVLGSFWFAIPTLVFLCSLYFLMNRLPFIQSLVAASGIWILAILIAIRLLPTG